MAEKTKTETKAEEQRVAVDVPRGAERDDPMQFIAVNGENFWLPKGETSEVPPAIAAEFQRAQKAERAQNANRKKMLEKAK